MFLWKLSTNQQNLAHQFIFGRIFFSIDSALRLRQENSYYETVVKSAIALGNDTDTTACIAGGLAGIQYGKEAIPERWMQALRGKDLVEPLLNELLGKS